LCVVSQIIWKILILTDPLFNEERKAKQ